MYIFQGHPKNLSIISKESVHISEKKIDRHFEVLGKCKHMLGQPKNELNVIFISKYAPRVSISGALNRI